MITIQRYQAEYFQIWNDFNKKSKKSLFMFDRNYMEYHKDRFTDHSLLFFQDDALIALLPMCEREDILYSHGGLTYGGFITDENMKQHIMNDCFSELILYMRRNGFKKIVYKLIPWIFGELASEEDRYTLYALGAKLRTVDASTYVNLQNIPKMRKGRKANIARARREGVVVSERTELNDYERFIELENEVLSQRHNTKAVHTGAELKMLRDRFPDNIHLFASALNDETIAGVVVYEYGSAVHTQYMAANDTARQIGALDLAVAEVIEKYKGTKKWLDFGISTEHDRISLNEGLISQKESFGGRTGTYEIWELDVPDE